MSNPYKDSLIQKARERRRGIYERYTPIVLWVRPSSGENVENFARQVRSHLRDYAGDLPFVHVPEQQLEPRVKDVVTEFDNTQNGDADT